MKIAFTGGATGGHFYPILAIIEALEQIEEEKRLLPAELYFISVSPYDKRALFEKNVEYVEIKTGKMRRYFSFKNITDLPLTFFAILKAIRLVYKIFPDVVFGKGGYGSFPTLLAARIFRIPVIIHESDALPGRVNLWAGKFAKAVAISYPEAAKLFPEEKVVVTGNPIRKEILYPLKEGSASFLGLEEGRPTILVLGGSQGARVINEAILDALPVLLPKYQIVHQVGEKNKEEIESRLEGVLSQVPEEARGRYKMYPYLNDLALRMAAGAATIVISRSGSTIFEIASWGKPSILIPLTKEAGNPQTKNSYHYSRTGAALVVEEPNLTPHLIAAEVDRILNNKVLYEKMATAALKFGEHNATAADKIARELLRVAYEHEK
ncbi:UDP-N-acetylglucosamine--N-acetylmuramyl-(pentapeptide) pyrophosphoryl-undecaprenol N-acetylglucosamine transferase [bacterium]|nr:UDP-N-acetylglucosamine--N-acetylmuramyl-(pentapeptide) pyrophosphoryl-undecaprenol N-acetylglucosamine transferase [bacterium]